MKRRTFLISSSVVTLTSALPFASVVGQPFSLTPALDAASVVPLGLASTTALDLAWFKIQNWEHDSEGQQADVDDKTLLHLSSSWKAGWL